MFCVFLDCVIDMLFVFRVCLFCLFCCFLCWFHVFFVCLHVVCFALCCSVFSLCCCVLFLVGMAQLPNTRAKPTQLILLQRAPFLLQRAKAR
jgi:hypothetical protein